MNDLNDVKTGRDAAVLFCVYIAIGFALAIGFGAARFILGVIFG
jgi:hypothetical protein